MQAPGSRKALAWALAALPAALAFAVYAGVHDHELLLNWDDRTYVLENPVVMGLGWREVRAAFEGFYFGNYAPLHLLSYSVDRALWGLEPAGFLLTNVLLHAANGVLLFALLRRLGLAPAGAALAACLFVAHPVQVESVAWISERKNVLAMTFSLASLHAFVSFRTGRDPSARRWAYAASLAALVAALLCKAVAVVVPPVLLLLEAGPLGRGPLDLRARLRRAAATLPFFAAALALAAATVASQRDMISEGRTAFAMDAPTTALTMVPVLVRYVGMVLWPAGLSPIYTPAVRESPDATFWAALGGVALLAAAGALLLRRRRDAFTWYAAFFVALLPVMQLVPLPTLMNDRYLYFPMLGAAALAGLALDAALARGGPLRAAALAAGAAAVVALAAAASARTEAWRDDLSLWRDATEKAPESALAWMGLGTSLADRGRPAEAIAAYHRALAQNPSDARTLNNLGATYNAVGDPASGRPFLLRAVEVSPRYFEALMNLGLGYRLSGDERAAERAFSAALAARPGDPGALEALAAVRAASR
jgi:LPXTG-motif cell wall-anchored protein